MKQSDRVNILLVDDQPAKLLAYEVILKDLGENLIKANSAREALEFLLKNDVAVVLVDVCMPELDGFELAKMLREHPRYRIIELVGRGGMGSVYRAEHRLMNRTVAIKLVNSQLVRNPQAVQRFRREVRAAAALDHPHAVRVLEAGEIDGSLFLALQLVDGIDLATKLERERFRLAFHRSFKDPSFREVADALDAVERVAWSNYEGSRKAPVTRKAGAGFRPRRFTRATSSCRWR